MYEPGFFADRFPALAPLVWHLNAGFLFRAMGMLPVENQLSSRPLRSLAHSLEAIHGDLSLDTVLNPDIVSRLPGSPRLLSDVRTPRFGAAAHETIKLGHLQEPYRREMLTLTRAQVDADVAEIVRIVRAGSTFYINPEGTYSLDGRMHPLKGILTHVAPHATVMLLAVAYDPLRPGRLGMLYRTLLPANPHDIAHSLAAARPVTASALFAADLDARGDSSFSAEDVATGFLARLRTLPSAAFVDPELAAAPEDAARALFAQSLRRGIVVAEGDAFRRGAPQGDPRFPGVSDMVAYQAAFLDETVAALQILAGGANA